MIRNDDPVSDGTASRYNRIVVALQPTPFVEERPMPTTEPRAIPGSPSGPIPLVEWTDPDWVAIYRNFLPGPGQIAVRRNDPEAERFWGQV